MPISPLRAGLIGLPLTLLGLLTAPAARAQAPDWQQAIVGSLDQPAAGTSTVAASAPDAAGNILITGTFTGQVNYGSTVLRSAGGTDIYLAKWSTTSKSWVWAVRAGGTGDDAGTDVAVSGPSIYVSGSFSSATNASIAGTALSGAGNTDAFLAKYTDAGSAATGVWAVSGGGNSADMASSVAVSGSEVYLAGSLTSGSNAQMAGTSLSGAGAQDLFLARYTDAGATANNGWAVTGGGTGTDWVKGLAVNGSSVYLTGTYQGSAAPRIAGQLMPGTNAQNYYLYTAKYTDTGSAAAGSWAVSANGAISPGLSASSAGAVAVSGSSVYVTGAFAGTTTLAGTTFSTASGATDLFVVKYTDSGNAAQDGWAVRETSASRSPVHTAGRDILASNGTVYVAGANGGRPYDRFGSTAGSLSGPGVGGFNLEVVAINYTDNGSSATRNWAAGAGSYADEQASTLALSSTGQLYVGVNSQGVNSDDVCLFNRAPERLTTPVKSGALAQLDLTTRKWLNVAYPLQGGSSKINGSSADGNGNVYVVGSFTGSIAFGDHLLTSAGGNDMFVAKWNAGSSTWQWAVSGGGTEQDYGHGIAVSGTSVFVAGTVVSYRCRVDESRDAFWQIAGLTSFNSCEERGIVVKLTDNGSSASGVWTAGTSIGINPLSKATGVAVRGTSVYVTGSARFTPFITKIQDRGTSPATIWNYQSSGVYNFNVALDATDGIYFTGAFQGTSNLGGTNLTSAGGLDIMVGKITDQGSSFANGWAVRGGGAQDDRATAIALRGNRLYVTGQYGSGGGASLGGTALPAGSQPALFVAQYAAAPGGATLGWVQTAANPGAFSAGRSLVVTGADVFVTGEYQSPNTVAGTGLNSYGGLDLFVARYTDAGSSAAPQGAASGGSASADSVRSISLAGGSAYIGGTVLPPATLGTMTVLNPAGLNTGLLGRLTAPTAPAFPAISAFSPGSGSVGSTVVLTGSAFTGVTAVSFNGTPATSFTVDSDGQITATVPVGATTGLLAVTSPLGTGTSAANFTILAADVVVATAQNLSGAYHNVTITGTGTATLTGPLKLTGTLTVQAGGTLLTNCQPVRGTGSFVLQAGGTLGICDAAGIRASSADTTGAIRLTGSRSFSPDASYRYNGTLAQQTGSGLPATVRNLELSNAAGLTLSQALSVGQVLTLTTGPLNTAARPLTLLSSASGTALVVNGAGTVNGPVTVQRYLSPARNAGLGYRHLSAPVQNTTVADLATTGFTPVINAAYNTSATPNLVTPFPSVFGYDQSRLSSSPATSYGPFDKGWFSPASTTSALAVGRGYTVNVAAGRVVDFVGTLNNGDQVLNLARGPEAEAGWELVGNPYPAPLDWSQVAAADRVGLAGSMYVFESTTQYQGRYRSYVNGIGNPVLPLGQAFFVRVLDTNPTASLTLRNAQRLTSPDTTALRRGMPDLRPQLQLSLSGAGAAPDEAYVYFEAGATDGVDAEYDARKLPNSTGLNLAALAGAEPLAIAGLPALTAATVVPLQVQVPAAGTYSLRAAALRNLPTGARVWLRDVQTGQDVDLQRQPVYTFTLSGPATNSRFVLVFRPGSVTASAGASTANLASVYPNPAHQRFRLRVAGDGRSQTAAATLYNALGQAVQRKTLPLGRDGGQAEFDVKSLPAGMYVLRLSVGSQQVTRRVVIE